MMEAAGERPLRVTERVTPTFVRVARMRLVAVPHAEAESRGGDEGSIIAGPVMSAVLRASRRVASSRIAVVLTGETGTGKEVLARYIHDHSADATAPMISVNCGAI